MFRKFPGPFLLIFVVAGIVLADQFRLPGWLFLFFCLVAGLLGIISFGRGAAKTAILLFGLSLFFFAGFHFSAKFYDFGPNHISRFVSEKETHQVFGKVADWPVLKANRTEIKIAIDSMGRDQKSPVKGNIQLNISDTTTALQRGDRVEFQGTVYPLRIKGDPGEFDYARYLQLQGVFGVVYLHGLLDVRVDRSRRFGIIGIVDKIRSELTASFNRNLSPAAAALASGILIGETRNIPAELYNRFRDSGTLHLLAVSGSNVALVILFIILILRPFSIKRKHRAFILIFCVFLFALLSYGEPSVVRASLMAVLVLLATIIERRFDLNQIIATAAVIILLVDPAQLFSVGFQLSFVTAWGLIFIVPKIANLFKAHQNKPWFRWLALPFIVAAVAQISSMPLIAYYFDKVPAISVAANLVIVPLVSIAVVASLLLVVLDLIWPMLGQFFGSLLDSFVKIVTYFLDLFGGENSKVISTGELSGAAVLLIYSLIIFATLSLLNKTYRRIAVAVIIVLANVVLTLSIVQASNEDKTLNYLDIFNIPGGMAIVVHSSTSNRPDLLITGLDSKSYPIDERIFEPSLSALRVKKLARVFVLSSEFGAIDDILRLSKKYEADTVFVDKRLARSFADMANSLEPSFVIPKVVTFAKNSEPISPTGIFPDVNAVLIKFENSDVLVTNELFRFEQIDASFEGQAALITPNITEKNTDYTALQKFSLIVCSKGGHHLSPVPPTESSPQIYSIERLGPCRLHLPEDISKSLVIETIR